MYSNKNYNIYLQSTETATRKNMIRRFIFIALYKLKRIKFVEVLYIVVQF
jgi:hypothetical protein